MRSLQHPPSFLTETRFVPEVDKRESFLCISQLSILYSNLNATILFYISQTSRTSKFHDVMDGHLSKL
jgi:hypothetical protein